MPCRQKKWRKWRRLIICLYPDHNKLQQPMLWAGLLSGPSFSIQAPVLDGFRQMLDHNVVAVC